MPQKTDVSPQLPAPFLVVESNPIIAADLVQSIGECPGGGPADAVRDHAGAVRELSRPGARVAIFVPAETRDEHQLAATLSALARINGAAIVAMSGTLTPQQARALGWHLLPLPFTPAMVHAVVAAISTDIRRPDQPAP